jgi:hypothetical protein
MKTYALPVSILILAAALIVGVFMSNTYQATGSVITGGEYRSTEVDSLTGTTSLKKLPGSIGSIIVDEDGTAGALYFYATTSTATSSADLIFGFDGVAVEGTYQYDISFGKGLLLEDRGFNGQAVITYR